MNTQNNKQDRLLDLLTPIPQGDDSHNIRTHLKKRLEDQEVVDAMIDYTSTRVQLQSMPGSKEEYGGNSSFTTGRRINPENGTRSGDGIIFTTDRRINSQSKSKTFEPENRIRSGNDETFTTGNKINQERSGDSLT